MIESTPEISVALKEYQALGFDTLPLQPGTKTPAGITNWQYKDSSCLWENAPWGANIGIRCGGNKHLAVIDCDEKNTVGTYKGVEAILTGLGIHPDSYPLGKTCSEVGRHVYLRITESLSGDIQKLNPKIGAGELRYGKGSYVVGPPSIVEQRIYKLISGNYSHIPVVRSADLFSSLQIQIPLIQQNYPKPHFPRKALQLLNDKGRDEYDSLSEVDEAIIVILINASWRREQIKNLLLTYPYNGKFQRLLQENPATAFSYFDRSYDSAKEFCENNISKGRQYAERAYKWANSFPWKGRTGANDRAVFLAHVKIAFESGKIIYHASQRELAEKSGTSRVTASHATNRLCNKGFVLLAENSVASLANKYSLGKIEPLPHNPPVREWTNLSNHDAFRFRGLGKSGEEIWNALSSGPKTVVELTRDTGRHRKTVQRKLDRMSALVDLDTGEIHEMVFLEDGKYRRNEDIDLDCVAEALGTKGMGDKQEKKHAEERALHKRSLNLLSKQE
jgi:predicted transcriptional regulator